MTGKVLTAAMLRVLQGIADAEAADALEDAESVCDGLQCWRGDDQTSLATVNALLKLTLVSPSSWPGGSDVYIGRAVLRRPELAVEVQAALVAGKPFTVQTGGTLVLMEPEVPPVPVMLAGSHRRGAGVVVHAIPGPFDWNHTVGPALCGAKPGARSAGWAPMPHLSVTCGRCTRRMLERDASTGDSQR